ncbi:hypothetical protein NA8A_20712 [Nitratireductor indicus C115]|uniref:Uncharacterized protein n=1 Tax=Nitratireductor indicus C115 TaxID=1231190 RepID=K2NMF9_9HYPH|nr:hypothetical protein [Nitratireductor indicus]EKF40585.1 hypothetical protein NA8A_20712 [Nitratireductor indicus C115]
MQQLSGSPPQVDPPNIAPPLLSDAGLDFESDDHDMFFVSLLMGQKGGFHVGSLFEVPTLKAGLLPVLEVSLTGGRVKAELMPEAGNS